MKIFIFGGLTILVIGVGLTILELVGGHETSLERVVLNRIYVSIGSILLVVGLIPSFQKAVARWAFKRAFRVSPKLDHRIVNKAVHVAVEKAIGRLQETAGTVDRSRRVFEECASALRLISVQRNKDTSDLLSRLNKEWKTVQAARRARRRAEKRLRKLVVLAGRCHVLVEVPSEAASLGVGDLFRQVA